MQHRLDTDSNQKSKQAMMQMQKNSRDSTNPYGPATQFVQTTLASSQIHGERQPTGTERGTVYHTLMQHLPLSGSVVDETVVDETISRLLAIQILLPYQAEAIGRSELIAF